MATVTPSTAASTSTSTSTTDSLSDTDPPIAAPLRDGINHEGTEKTYAEIFTGVRQDSGDPEGFVKTMRDFYESCGITSKKTIVFSDSLDVDRCLEYKNAAEAAGFQASFGVGTFLTNDFVHASDGKTKSVPLNIVVKLSSAGGMPAIKISDNIGKNTGDSKVVREVKERLGYVEKEWRGGDEKARWGNANGATSVAS